MSIADTAFAKVNVGVNKLVKPCLESARFHKLISGQMAMVSYVGRRSGKTFSLPVAYKRKDDTVSIMVALPDHKQWWRNFEGDGGTLQLKLKGADHTGHAISSRDEKGRVTVKVQLAD